MRVLNKEETLNGPPTFPPRERCVRSACTILFLDNVSVLVPISPSAGRSAPAQHTTSVCYNSRPDCSCPTKKRKKKGRGVRTILFFFGRNFSDRRGFLIQGLSRPMSLSPADFPKTGALLPRDSVSWYHYRDRPPTGDLGRPPTTSLTDNTGKVERELAISEKNRGAAGMLNASELARGGRRGRHP